MKKNKKWTITFIPIILIILFSLSIFYYSYEQDCKDDISCYNNNLITCKKAKLTITEEGSTYIYQITGESKNKCDVKVTLLSMSEETNEEVKNLFEGKHMDCKIEKESTFNTEILPYCTGPLKESIYELTIQKMYNILAQSLGDIIATI
jgi:hypothetical protein|tara:strand:- start:818 stop:1264 length:447 start_codon:yes stop_codon:yes gene_type:complete